MTRAQSNDGRTTSIWIDTGEVPDTRPLETDLTSEIVIVGAGIAGLSVAYELVRRGHAVTVIEAGQIGGGQSGRTTAHLASALDDRYHSLERLHGERGARLASESHRAAIDRVEAIINDENISCDFQRNDGYLFLGEGDDPIILEQELDAALRAGELVERAETAPLPFDVGPCLRFRRQAQFHPLKYLAGLARAILRMGGQIYTDTHADKITTGLPSIIETSTRHQITADVVVVATNVPVNDQVVMHTKQAPYRTYAIGAPVARGTVPYGLYWDTLDPYHYVRVQPLGDQDLLIIGGEDHKTGQETHPEKHWDALETWARQRFAMLGEVTHRWSGQVIEPVDGLAFIGRNPLDSDHVFIVTGDSGHGMTHGVIAGVLIADLIEGEHNRWAPLYDPRRRTLKSLGEFAKENGNVVRQYSDWMKKGDADDPSQIAPGEGAVIRRGLQLIATYVDEQGLTHACSAVCPHLAGIVRWNSAEKTWDCPCHGSRFDALGRVIEGPAIVGLEPLPATRLKKPERKSTRDETPMSLTPKRG